MFDVKAAKERLPAPVDISIGGVGLGPPQPERLGLTPAGQVLDSEPMAVQAMSPIDTANWVTTNAERSRPAPLGSAEDLLAFRTKPGW